MSGMTDRTEQMQGGACMDLVPEVLDKYFTPNMLSEPFNHYTARAICGNCAIRATCLADAIASPEVFDWPRDIVRAGEPGMTIKDLRRRHFLNGESVKAIVADPSSWMSTTAGDVPFLRKGNFADAELFEGPLA